MASQQDQVIKKAFLIDNTFFLLDTIFHSSRGEKHIIKGLYFFK